MKEFAQAHLALFWLGIASLLVSLRIVLGLWFLPAHRETGVVRRLFWSFIAWLPFAGPIFYGAFFKVPSVHNNALPIRPEITASGHSAS